MLLAWMSSVYLGEEKNWGAKFLEKVDSWLSLLQQLCVAAHCHWRHIHRVRWFIEVVGVHITKDLSWAVHCDYVIKKANRRLYILRNLRKVEYIRMILLLSTVHLSDLYLNMQPLLLLISPIISPVAWRKSKSAPSPLSIPLLHMKMNHSDFISIMWGDRLRKRKVINPQESICKLVVDCSVTVLRWSIL